MKIFQHLSPNEKEELLKFPAYISLLAVNSHGGMDAVEKKYAINLSHIKTYSCDPLLYVFYQEADKVFTKNIEELDRELPHEIHERDAAIKSALSGLDKILVKLGENYTETMHRSMQSFKDHVSKANRNVLEYFIFPLPIKGIND